MVVAPGGDASSLMSRGATLCSFLWHCGREGSAVQAEMVTNTELRMRSGRGEREWRRRSVVATISPPSARRRCWR